MALFVRNLLQWAKPYLASLEMESEKRIAVVGHDEALCLRRAASWEGHRAVTSRSGWQEAARKQVSSLEGFCWCALALSG